MMRRDIKKCLYVKRQYVQNDMLQADEYILGDVNALRLL